MHEQRKVKVLVKRRWELKEILIQVYNQFNSQLHYTIINFQYH